MAPGTYDITVGQPLGYQFTTEYATGNPIVDSGVNQLTGVSSAITLTDGASAATINAGLTVESGTASIGGNIVSVL